MRKPQHLFLLPFIVLACNSASENTTVSEGIPAGAFIEKFEDTPNQERATLKAGEKVQAQGDYLNGQKHGTWTEYNTNGTVKSVTTYLNGLKEGTSLSMNDRGEVLSLSNYHRDMLHGQYQGFNRSRIIEEKVYVNGNLEGLVKKYYNNGKLMEESPYENGKINGTAIWYDQEGNVLIEYEYKQGELVKK